MSVSLSQMIKYVPLAIALLILGVGSLFIPWENVTPYLLKLRPESYVFILLAGIVYYLSRVVRYYFMLRVLNTPRPFIDTLIAYFVAQPASLVPGGEAYKTVTLKKHANVHMSNSLPIVFLQSFTESIGLVLLALVSTLWLHEYAFIILAVFSIYIIILILARTRRLALKHHSIINKLPFITVTKNKILSFINKNKVLLSGKNLVVLIATGLVPSLIAAFVLYYLAINIGVKLSFAEAVIALSIPAVLQNISFLPGGLGINEQSSIGILLIIGASLPAAVALTIMIRLVTLGLGILLGTITILLVRLISR